jgi:hypothetical protein
MWSTFVTNFMYLLVREVHLQLPSDRKLMETFTWNLILGTSMQSVEKIQIWLKSCKNIGHFTRRQVLLLQATLNRHKKRTHHVIRYQTLRTAEEVKTLPQQCLPYTHIACLAFVLYGEGWHFEILSRQPVFSIRHSKWNTGLHRTRLRLPEATWTTKLIILLQQPCWRYNVSPSSAYLMYEQGLQNQAVSCYEWEYQILLKYVCSTTWNAGMQLRGGAIKRNTSKHNARYKMLKQWLCNFVSHRIHRLYFRFIDLINLLNKSIQ